MWLGNIRHTRMPGTSRYMPVILRERIAVLYRVKEKISTM
jgi:hypothetical protein